MGFAGFGLAGVIGAQQLFEGVEAAGPEALIMAQPLVGTGEWARFQPADMGPAADLAPDQAGVFEHFHMLGRAGEAHGEGLGEFADGALPEGETGQHAAACRVAERAKHSIEVRIKFNHKVEYLRC